MVLYLRWDKNFKAYVAQSGNLWTDLSLGGGLVLEPHEIKLVGITSIPTTYEKSEQLISELMQLYNANYVNLITRRKGAEAKLSEEPESDIKTLALFYVQKGGIQTIFD